jgi:hypothetical protein
VKLNITVLTLVAASFAQSSKGASQEEFLKQVLSALVVNNEKALSDLTISKEDFKKYVWPNIMTRVSHPGDGMTPDKFYDTYKETSQVGIKQDSQQLGGTKWEVVKVTPGTIQKKAKDYTLFLAPEVVVRDPSGQQKTIHLVGGMLERAGELKVTSYFSRAN